MKFNISLFHVAAALILTMPAAGFCTTTVLAESGKSAVTSVDVQGDALRVPAEMRKPTLAKPEAVQQLANNLVIRRALAAEAEAAGIANDPAIQAAIQIARDRILSDALFARMDAANKPARQVVEALASTNYKADPKRFDLPEEFGASHILIKSDTPDAKAKADAILAELKAGADFAALARKHSQDGNAQSGGSLGFFQAGQMVGPFDAAVQKMQKPGELSDVVQTQFGYHIIKFEGRRSAGVRPFEQVKEVLMREAEAKILSEKRLEHVQKIQATVKFNQSAIESFAESNSK
jgi:peptidyl-prolyl cis-trans isomerase C